MENVENGDVTKDFVESLYKGKEADDLIHSFLESAGVDPNDCFIDRTYDPKTGELVISLQPLKRITFKRRERCKDNNLVEKEGKKMTIVSSSPVTKELRDSLANNKLSKEISVTKEKGEKIHIHTSKRFPDNEVRDIVQEKGLSVVDEVNDFAPIAGQGTMKLLIIKNEK